MEDNQGGNEKLHDTSATKILQPEKLEVSTVKGILKAPTDFKVKE